MRFVASIYPDWDAAYAEHCCGASPCIADQTIKALSHGERVKATLLLALAHRPRLLLLDEPTTGLDPVARHEVLAELMDVIRDERRAILFSSHNTQDVEQISDVITFLDRGRVIDSSDKETFLDRWRRVHLDCPARRHASDRPGRSSTRSATDASPSSRRSAYSPDVHAACEHAGALVRDVQRMTLEEIFVANVMQQPAGACAHERLDRSPPDPQGSLSDALARWSAPSPAGLLALALMPLGRAPPTSAASSLICVLIILNIFS